MLSAILLAAGSSRRMGSINKLLLPWQDNTILGSIAASILAAGPHELIVVTGHEAPATTAAIRHLPLQIVHNPRHEEGMTGSIQTGVEKATGKGYMICLADMVLLSTEEYVLLKTAFENQYQKDPHCILLPEYNGQKGNPVIFSSAYRHDILTHPEKEGCKDIVRHNPNHHFRLQMPSDHILRDMDDPDDYRISLDQFPKIHR